MEEVMVSGYCREIDGNRVLCCEETLDGMPVTDCLFPKCTFSDTCVLIRVLKEKIQDK
jgi:hypothetical protein